ncbi:hypothetical protein SAMN05216330_105568 [Bradyrhizobium sp. Ghvi]|uniref:hypothetical protein n=1 Tax=Bradyrhizobium sp. Ghvi TaxID=1855319 RepID=UPI0008E1082C|nr:hypothetical protein [Bradyrhizobium sp. Ghvi]SFP09049.1 hypothetical protein SAMN05216330_105568 [Bradyrhizobium sp. Ghvi]
MRFVLASFFQENVSQLPVREELRLLARFTRSVSEPFAQRLLLPDSSSYLAHLSRNAGKIRRFRLARYDFRRRNGSFAGALPLICKEDIMSVEGKIKEGAGYIKEEMNEHGKDAKSQRKAQEGRDLRNEGRMEDGKPPKTTKPGTGH